MFEFLKKLFSVSEVYNRPTFSTGAFESPIDTRRISLAAIQKPVTLPTEYKTNIEALPVEDQLGLGICVAASHVKLVQYYFFRKTGQILSLSHRAIYKWAKAVDGLPDVQGTYPDVVAKILVKKGVPLEKFAPNFNWLSHQDYLTVDLAEAETDALTRKLPGYAYVLLDLYSIKQAIYQNGMITGVTDVDSNWFVGLIQKIFKALGRHNTVWYGFDAEGIFARNSWGSGWKAQMLNKLFGPGEFYFKWEDYKNNAYDLISYLDIPADVLEEAKKKEYIFISTLKLGSKGFEVQKLQERLTKETGVFIGADGSFGPRTKEAVISYQKSKRLLPDGIVGQATRESLNGKVSYLDRWCEAIKTMEDAKPYRNNPGNIKYVGQKYAVKDGAFCKFDTYEHGYQALKDLLIRACTGRSPYYSPEMTLFEFYAGVYNDNGTKKYPGYAPKEDNNNPTVYSRFVAQRIGVSVETKIKSLI